MNWKAAAVVGIAALVGAKLLAPKPARVLLPDQSYTDPGWAGASPLHRPVLGNQAAVYWNRLLPGGPGLNAAAVPVSDCG